MKLAIGSDKSGFNLKESIKAYLTEQGVAFDDLGTTDLDHVKPYYVVASTVAPLVQNGTYDRAILICGTGAGVSVVSNKYKGVYAVACESLYAAKMCRAINDANILCMGGWIVAPEMGIEMTKAFLGTDFLQDLEEWRQAFLTNAKGEVKKVEDGIYD
ncbi:MAG: RpiB/LacA/LacB family sugar-phosphate isomerase [Clostridia bacterium]|jgi:ribose 5-phosphate isomerase B|nr:RpiB/LacA/LacB family sugar-phosphate isomerase [Clostridia bacterium]